MLTETCPVWPLRISFRERLRGMGLALPGKKNVLVLTP